MVARAGIHAMVEARAGIHAIVMVGKGRVERASLSNGALMLMACRMVSRGRI